MSYIQTGATREVTFKTIKEMPIAEIVCDGCKRVMAKHIEREGVPVRLVCDVRPATRMSLNDYSLDRNVPGGWGEFCSVECVAGFARNHGLPEAPQP